MEAVRTETALPVMDVLVPGQSNTVSQMLARRFYTWRAGSAQMESLALTA